MKSKKDESLAVKDFRLYHLDNFKFRKEDQKAFGFIYFRDYLKNFLINKKNYALCKQRRYYDDVIFIISFDILWRGVAEIWGIVNKDFLDYRIAIIRNAKSIIDNFIIQYNINRLECKIIDYFEKSHAMIEYLNFKKEAILLNYGFNKEAYIQYSRIINGHSIS